MANDPYWNSVVLAMHMDDTSLTDLKGNTVTINGNAARSATQSVFGGYSAHFDGTGDFLGIPYSSALNLRGSDFTVEVLAMCEKTTGSAIIFDFRGTGEWSASWCIYIDCSARSAHIYDGTTNTVVLSTAGGSVPGASEWFKMVIGRSGTTTTLRVVRTDGTNYSVSATYNPPVTHSSGVRIGISQSSSDALIGYIDDLLITKAVSRYSGDVPWPTEAFPNTPPQLSGTVKDASGAFVARTVRSYRRSTGALIDSDTSSASDGSFTLDAYDASAHYIVCLDDNFDENAIILDNITPV